MILVALCMCLCICRSRSLFQSLQTGFGKESSSPGSLAKFLGCWLVGSVDRLAAWVHGKALYQVPKLAVEIYTLVVESPRPIFLFLGISKQSRCANSCSVWGEAQQKQAMQVWGSGTMTSLSFSQKTCGPRGRDDASKMKLSSTFFNASFFCASPDCCNLSPEALMKVISSNGCENSFSVRRLGLKHPILPSPWCHSTLSILNFRRTKNSCIKTFLALTISPVTLTMFNISIFNTITSQKFTELPVI